MHSVSGQAGHSVWWIAAEILDHPHLHLGLPGWLCGKEFACHYRRHRRPRDKIPWRRKWQPTPVFLPEKSHEQRSLADCSPWGSKELDSTERLNNNSSLDALDALIPKSDLQWRWYRVQLRNFLYLRPTQMVHSEYLWNLLIKVMIVHS